MGVVQNNRLISNRIVACSCRKLYGSYRNQNYNLGYFLIYSGFLFGSSEPNTKVNGSVKNKAFETET